MKSNSVLHGSFWLLQKVIFQSAYHHGKASVSVTITQYIIFLPVFTGDTQTSAQGLCCSPSLRPTLAITLGCPWETCFWAQSPRPPLRSPTIQRPASWGIPHWARRANSNFFFSLFCYSSYPSTVLVSDSRWLSLKDFYELYTFFIWSLLSSLPQCGQIRLPAIALLCAAWGEHKDT